MREFFAVEIRKNGAQPRLKPLIIRAGDITANPVSDQWTLSGVSTNFYRSNTSSFLSNYIEGHSIDSFRMDERVSNVVRVFNEIIQSELESSDSFLAHGLLNANGIRDGNLFNFMAYPPNLQKIEILSAEEQAAYYGGMALLAVCSFLKNSCHLVVIECLDLGLAFDMFQSLNATGTPLTAFEVFKPMIVKAWGNSYSTSIKSEVDRIERVFESESTASGKEELTDRVIVSSALAFNGEIISKRFSDERDWLTNTLPQPIGSLSSNFIKCIADQAQYCHNFILPRRSAKNSSNFGLVSHLQSLGLTQQQADLSALCVFYLKDAGHQFAHSVMSVFYAKLLSSQGNNSKLSQASSDFLDACKAVASFFTLWMGAIQGKYPDAEYRLLFQSTTRNISVANGLSNQNLTFIKFALRKALEANSIYDANNNVIARKLWVDNAKHKAWYARKAVCRFALFSASHDAAPDLKNGNEGFFIQGMPNSANMLNCRSWHASDYEVIEHIATRDKPTAIKFPGHFDQSIYPGNNSIVDKLGNLTLLSMPVNSSVYSEWPDKVFYYWSLTTPSLTAAGPAGANLMNSLMLTSLPPSLSALTAASNFLPHLAPLALRGQNGLKWDSSFIDRRSENLCGRVFDTIDSWLR